MSSSWQTGEHKEFPKLEEDLQTDIAIVGGGLAGIWCAYLLAKAGQKVVVLEKDKVGHGETMYTTAFITQVIDTPLVELSQIFGEEVASLVWQAGAEAIDEIEAVVKKEKIECDFIRWPLETFARNSREYNELLREHRQAKRLGYETTIGWRKQMGFKNSGVFLVPHQAKYHPIKFLEGLTRGAERAGAKIYEHTEVKEISSGSPVKITAGSHTVEAREVVIATYDPFGNPPATKFKKGMYTSYVYELDIPAEVVKEGMYQDMMSPYHYFRVDPVGEGRARMIIGGEDHRSELKGLDKKSFKALLDYVKDVFPYLDYKIVRQWQGAILEPSDGLPLIGEVAPYHYVACAFSGNGMTYSAIAGKLLTDIIVGEGNKYVPIFDPTRNLTMRAVTHKAIDYTKEFFGGAVRNLFK
jgi:glycine/D-amino acid oxidase-like deaminating enzyme